MQLSDLRSSIASMDFSSAVLCIGRIREARRAPRPKSVSPKVQKAKKENAELRGLISGLSTDELSNTISELMKILEGGGSE